MGSQVIVGVDFGSSRIKAAAYDRSGEMVGLEAVDTPVIHVADGDDFPVLDLLGAAHDAVAALRSGPIAALGLTSMGEVGTVVTETGLAPVDFPAWYDDRGAEIIDALEDRWGATHLRDVTGRHCRTTSTAAKLGHAHASSTPVPAGEFVGLCGALAHQLTGSAWQEAGLATTSGVWDLLAGRYLTDLWDAAGLGHITLAPVRPPGHSAPAAGLLALSLGLEPGAAVVIAGHDHPVASVGAGVRSGDVSDSMGTGEAIIAALPREPALTQEQLAAYLDRDPDLTFELWPTDGALLAVWERMRPGLAMRTFLESSGIERRVLDDGAAPPSVSLAFSGADLAALQAGHRVASPYDAHAWGELIDAYVLLANEGEELARAVSGATGATVLTGGGLRSRRWREAKVALGPRRIEVSTVTEAATRGCAAIAGASLGWWPTAEEMPGATRTPVSSAVEMEEVASALVR
ncbi:FGGY family carbohydrate kinase [Pseudactinotalea suaedae]|uniref:FGGY family carbohydrate kinase n=1 Tax=Pseudactinotalea suaedae TaxID=1524924 RepID=UPI0012E313A0|nr:FGGY family carbohydrate kinase [Pseudactinotalea suaedae]